MIKYLGSKKRLVPVLGDLFDRAQAHTVLDLFTGTTRVAQEMKRRGGLVTAVDLARYSKVFADTWIATDADSVSMSDLEEALADLSARPARAGYVTETFCRDARFFQPFNGERIDAIRDAIEEDYADSPLYPILLTSLLLAADRVDSTTGIQMAFVKKWAERSFKPLELRAPILLPGAGAAIRGDALEVVPTLGHFDLAYLDPPYNQHRYYANYHIWETLVAWDKPEAYGIARKRLDVRDDATKSRFNEKRGMPEALRAVIAGISADVMVISYNNESWVSRDDLLDMCGRFEEVVMLAFDAKRYVGAQIGIHNPRGERVGEVSHLRNHEWVVVAGPRDRVRDMTAPYTPQGDGNLSGVI